MSSSALPPVPPPYRHTDGRTLRLGKGPAKFDSKRFMLRDFLISPAAAPPEAVNWYGKVTSFGEMLNADLSDCVPAAIGHAEQVATLNTPTGEVTPTDDEIEMLYEQSC